MPNAVTHKVLECLAKNKIAKALDELKQIIESEEYQEEDAITDMYRDYWFPISRSFDKINREFISDAISKKEFDKEKNILIEKIGYVCDELEKEIKNIAPKPNIFTSNKSGDEEKQRVINTNLYAAAGNGGDAMVSISDNHEMESILISGLDKNRKHFAIKVKGDSMNPTLDDGDTLIIYKILPTEIIPNQIYVIRDGNTLETNVKRIKISPETQTYILKSDNPIHEDKEVKEDDCFFYKVAKSIRNYK